MHNFIITTYVCDMNCKFPPRKLGVEVISIIIAW